MKGPHILPVGAIGEWGFSLDGVLANPFVDAVADVEFISPSGRSASMPAFYDGEATWRVRFSPREPGEWHALVHATPASAGTPRQMAFRVTPGEPRTTLATTPGRAWGFSTTSGEPVFLLGDTVYNLFGMAHCGGDVDAFLRRRAAQGFNLLRVRVPVSPFHPPRGWSDWQTRRTWPWGGSEQSPMFDRFHLEYFHTVDDVVRRCEELGLGLEMIMEGWGFEFPFCRRDAFVPEWEDLWMRYLIARYDAYNCVWFWTLMNEYEFYPDGDWRYNRVADLWAMRRARWIKALAPHGHIVSVHNGPRMPRFAERFARDPGAVDAILFQDWGSRDAEYGWLADGIEDTIAAALDGWHGSAVFAEWGYERNPEFDLRMPSHAYCDPEHTRRGAWRGTFCALGIIHGFENSWGPWMVLDRDLPGLPMLQIVRRFFAEVLPFASLRPAPHLVLGGPWERGRRPLALASTEGAAMAVYLPVGGEVTLALPDSEHTLHAEWFNPLTGALTATTSTGPRYVAPEGQSGGHPQDWVLVLR